MAEIESWVSFLYWPTGGGEKIIFIVSEVEIPCPSWLLCQMSNHRFTYASLMYYSHKYVEEFDLKLNWMLFLKKGLVDMQIRIIQIKAQNMKS